MRRSLSSAWTFFYKFLLPVVLTGAFAVAMRAVLEKSGAYSADSSNAFPAPAIVLVVAAVAALASYSWFCARLKRVRLSDDGETLLISNFFDEWRVPIGLVSEVTQNRLIKLRPITIHLRIDPGCGTQVTFMPPVRINFRFWRDDPEVEELRRLAALHAPI